MGIVQARIGFYSYVRTQWIAKNNQRIAVETRHDSQENLVQENKYNVRNWIAPFYECGVIIMLFEKQRSILKCTDCNGTGEELFRNIVDYGPVTKKRIRVSTRACKSCDGTGRFEGIIPRNWGKIRKIITRSLKQAIFAFAVCITIALTLSTIAFVIGGIFAIYTK